MQIEVSLWLLMINMQRVIPSVLDAVELNHVQLGFCFGVSSLE